MFFLSRVWKRRIYLVYFSCFVATPLSIKLILFSSKFLRIVKRTSCNACNRFISFNFLKLEAIQSENSRIFLDSPADIRIFPDRGWRTISQQSYCRLLRFSSQRREFLSRPPGREGRKREWVKVDVGVDTFIVSDPFRISSDVHFNFSKKSRLLGTM